MKKLNRYLVGEYAKLTGDDFSDLNVECIYVGSAEELIGVQFKDGSCAVWGCGRDLNEVVVEDMFDLLN